ncbi:unnamed protein product [marine sediment metagenome]|uniref:Uncharacterized protein n=1 Tax=marine sediment metagenome TaxID=412755 RepID=X1UY37_9ZZZZ
MGKGYDKKVKVTRILLSDYLVLKRLGKIAGVSMAEALHQLVEHQGQLPMLDMAAKPMPVTVARSMPVTAARSMPVTAARSMPITAVRSTPITVSFSREVTTNGHKQSG